MNDNKPSQELLLTVYAATAATAAVGELAAVGAVSKQSLDDLQAWLTACTSRSTGFAKVDQHLAGLHAILRAAASR